MTIEKLLCIQDELFAFCDLREDNIYALIPKEKREYYIQMGIDTGKKAAQKYAKDDLIKLLEDDGVKLQRYSEHSPVALHSQIEYDGKTKKLDLFVDTAQRISNAMQKTPWPISAEQVENMFIAHEFYHWTEYSSGDFTNMHCTPLRVRTFGIFNRTLQVRSVNEIAAFAFTKTWCEAPIHPKFMDYALARAIAGTDISDLLSDMHALYEEYSEALRQHRTKSG